MDISPKYKAISLFSGAMGLDLGIERAGFDIRVCVELDKLATETIRLNTSIPVIQNDINNVTTKEILSLGDLKTGEVDLVFGGPPCQSFSTAGARRALNDQRGNAILSFLRVVRETQPKVFLLENVRGLLSSKLNEAPKGYEKYNSIINTPGGVMYFLKTEFENLGYTITFNLFDSANYGVPQRRERVLIFGTKSKQSIQLPIPTHTENGENNTKKWVTIGEAFQGLDPQEHAFIQFRDTHLRFLKKLRAGQYWKHLSLDDQKKALGKSFYLSGGRTGFYRRLSWDKPSPALVTTPIMPATMLCHPEELRPLSIQEYARIQMFPDTWKFAGPLVKVYKQIGNAVPVGLAYMAGKVLIDHLDGKQEKNDIDYARISFSRYKNTDHQSFNYRFQPEKNLSLF